VIDIERYSFDQSHSPNRDEQQTPAFSNESTINNNGPSFEYDPKLPKLNKFSVSVKSRISGSNVIIMNFLLPF